MSFGPPEFRAYPAVQDGMTAADVVPHLPRHNGIFVGGSLRWKLGFSAARNASRCAQARKLVHAARATAKG